MTPADRLRSQAEEAARKRLARTCQFFSVHATRPLFDKVMRIEGGRRVRVVLTMPGPVLVQFDPATGEILARSKPGQLDVLDEGFLDQ